MRLEPSASALALLVVLPFVCEARKHVHSANTSDVSLLSNRSGCWLETQQTDDERIVEECHVGREAGVISMSSASTRFAHVSSMLRLLGFEIRRVQPIALTDERVLALEAEFIRPIEPRNISRPTMSATLTHVKIWNEFAAAPRRTGDHDWVYVFEDDAMLDPMWDSSQFQCYLSGAERVAGQRNSSIIFLGGCPNPGYSAFLEGNGLAPPLAAVDCRQDNISLSASSAEPEPLRKLWLRPCATLCAHAYAVSRGAAGTLWQRMRARLDEIGQLRATHIPHTWINRYNVDHTMKSYFLSLTDAHARRQHPWPTCLVRHPTKTHDDRWRLGIHEVNGPIIQNLSEANYQSWHDGVPRCGRHPCLNKNNRWILPSSPPAPPPARPP